MEVNNLKKRDWFKGDRTLWAVIIIISVFSILPVYSASTNLEYVVNEGTTTKHIVKHILFVLMGLSIMRGLAGFKYQVLGRLSPFILLLAFGLLLIASFTGQKIDGASAARWINFAGISFQPSAVAYLSLIIYLCQYLSKKLDRERTLLENLGFVIVPILLVAGLVFKDNGSTGLIILAVSMMVLVIGQFSLKLIGGLFGASVVAIIVFVLLGLSGVIQNNRVHTWISRIETFSNPKNTDVNDDAIKAKTYQSDRAKAAIVHGKWTGVGAGKSAMKQSLPQSVSDFIYAIVIEEYGFIFGGVFLLFCYFLIIMRIVRTASRTAHFRGTLLALSIGVMIVVQLSVNIAVALNLIPVTGQPLPLVSYGGTSILLTYIQLGIIQNISSQIQVLDEDGGREQDIEEMSDIA